MWQSIQEFFKGWLHKFYLVCSWILCPNYCFGVKDIRTDEFQERVRINRRDVQIHLRDRSSIHKQDKLT